MADVASYKDALIAIAGWLRELDELRKLHPGFECVACFQLEHAKDCKMERFIVDIEQAKEAEGG